MDNAGNGPYAFIRHQITFGVAAIRTTSAIISGLLFDPTKNPTIMGEACKETFDVLQEDGGLEKTSLYKMKLLMYDWKFDENTRRPESLKDHQDVPDRDAVMWCKANNAEVELRWSSPSR